MTTRRKPIDWSAVGNAAFAVFIAFTTSWAAWNGQRNAAAIEKQAKVVDEVHQKVNGSMTLQKRNLAEVTAAKAAITHSPADLEAADKALQDYLENIGGHPPTLRKSD